MSTKIIRELRARKARHIDAMRAITATAKAENRDLTDSELRQFNLAKSEAAELTVSIEEEEELNERERTADVISAGGSTELRDVNGTRIGTFLSAAALRDERKIAAALGSNRRYEAADPSGEQGDLAAFLRGINGGKTTPGIRAGLVEGTDADGGYAVPSYVLAPIIKALVPASTMLAAGANMVVLDKQGDSFTIPAIDTIPTPAWRGESAAVTSAGPTFRVVTIVPRDLSFTFKVSRELLMDAPGMNQALNTVISQAFAKEIDRGGLIGSGAAPEIKGILNNTGVQTYDMGTNGAAVTDYSPIIKAKRLLADANAPAPNACIMSNREAEAFELLVDTLGQPMRRPDAIKNMLFPSTVQIPITDTHGTANNASNMYLGDFTTATFYMREQVSVLSLKELYAGTGEIGFACHARLDLALVYPQAFCVIEGVIP